MDGRNIFQNGKLCATLLVKNLNPTVYLRLNPLPVIGPELGIPELVVIKT